MRGTPPATLAGELDPKGAQRRPASPFLWEAWPSGRAFALATHSFLWRLRCRRGARLATGRLCVPAAVPLHYCKMSAVGLLEAVSRKQRPTCHSQISGPGFRPGPLTATPPLPPPRPSMTQEEPPASWGARRRKCAGVPTPPAALRVPCPPATLQGTFDPPLGAGPPPLF